MIAPGDDFIERCAAIAAADALPDSVRARALHLLGNVHGSPGMIAQLFFDRGRVVAETAARALLGPPHGPDEGTLSAATILLALTLDARVAQDPFTKTRVRETLAARITSRAVLRTPSGNPLDANRSTDEVRGKCLVALLGVVRRNRDDVADALLGNGALLDTLRALVRGRPPFHATVSTRDLAAAVLHELVQARPPRPWDATDRARAAELAHEIRESTDAARTARALHDLLVRPRLAADAPDYGSVEAHVLVRALASASAGADPAIDDDSDDPQHALLLLELLLGPELASADTCASLPSALGQAETAAAASRVVALLVAKGGPAVRRRLVARDAIERALDGMDAALRGAETATAIALLDAIRALLDVETVAQPDEVERRLEMGIPLPFSTGAASVSMRSSRTTRARAARRGARSRGSRARSPGA